VFERPLSAGANGCHFDLNACRARRDAARNDPPSHFPRDAANKTIDPLSFADSLSFRLKTGSDGSWEASFFST
jgi:hypothetical protein